MNKIYTLLLAAAALALPFNSNAAGNHHRITSLSDCQSAAKLQNSSVKPMKPGKAKANQASASSNGAVMLQGSPIFDVEGTMKNYIMSYITYSSYYYSEIEASGLKFTLCIDDDGETVYIRTLLPGYNQADEDAPGSWVEGVLDGNTITIPAGQQLCTYTDDGVSAVLCLEFGVDDDASAARHKAGSKKANAWADDDDDDDDDYWSDFDWDYDWDYGYGDEVDIENLSYQSELKLTLEADGSLSLASECADWVVVAYGFSDDEDYEGVYNYAYDYEFQAYGDRISFVTVPDDATIEQYTLRSTTTPRTVNVAFCGDDVYFQGLVEYYANDWTKGTINGSIITVKAGQYYDGDEYYLGKLGIGHLTSEGDGWYTDNEYDLLDEAEFSISDDKSEILYVDDDIYFLDIDPTTDYVYDGEGNYCFYLKVPATPAIPAKPSIQIGQSYGYTYLLCDIPDTDVDGKNLDADLLTYSLLFDDELVTFSTDDYYGLDEDLTEVPYYFEDDYYDFQVSGTLHYVFIYDTSWKNAGVFSTYTVGDVVNRSEVAYLYETGIENVNADANVAPKFYNLQGIELPANNLPKGIVLVKQGNSVRKVVVK